MTTSRTNPSDELLDILHPETNTWVRAVALLQTAGGLNVKLVPLQQELLQSLVTGLNQISELPNQIETGNAVRASAAQNLSTLVTSVTGTTNPRLQAIAGSLLDLIVQMDAQQASEAITLQKLDQIKLALESLKSSIEVHPLKTPLVKSILIESPDQQFQTILPNKVRSLRFRARKIDGVTPDIRYSFTNGQVDKVVGGSYMTLIGGEQFHQNDLEITGTLYVSSPTVNSLVEVLVFT